MELKKDDFEDIKLFRQCVIELKDHSLIKNNLLKANLTLQADQHSGSIQHYRIDSEALCSFLTALRPMCLQKESVYLGKVLNTVSKYVEGDQFNQQKRQIAKRFEHRSGNNAFKFNLFGEALYDRDIWDTYMNGQYFHKQAEQRRILKTLEEINSIGYTAFLHTVIEKTNCVLLADVLIENYLGN